MTEGTWKIVYNSFFKNVLIILIIQKPKKLVGFNLVGFKELFIQELKLFLIIGDETPIIFFSPLSAALNKRKKNTNKIKSIWTFIKIWGGHFLFSCDGFNSNTVNNDSDCSRMNL